MQLQEGKFFIVLIILDTFTFEVPKTLQNAIKQIEFEIEFPYNSLKLNNINFETSKLIFEYQKPKEFLNFKDLTEIK